MTYKPKDLVLVPVPFTNLQATKVRPVLILHSPSNSEDFICCAVTSKIKDAHYSTTITNKDVVGAKLPKKSEILVNKLFTLEKNIIIKTIGELSKDKFEEVKRLFVKLIKA